MSTSKVTCTNCGLVQGSSWDGNNLWFGYGGPSRAVYCSENCAKDDKERRESMEQIPQSPQRPTKIDVEGSWIRKILQRNRSTIKPAHKIDHHKIHLLLDEAFGGARFSVRTEGNGASVDVLLAHNGIRKRFFAYSGGFAAPDGRSKERHLLERSLEALVLQFVTDVAQLKRSGYLEGTELVLKTGGE